MLILILGVLVKKLNVIFVKIANPSFGYYFMIRSLCFYQIPASFYTRKVTQDLRPPECHWMLR